MSYEKRKSIRRLTLVMMLNHSIHWCTVGVIVPVLSLFILAKGMDYLQLGVIMAFYSGSVVLAELPTGGLADAIGRKTVYLLSLVIQFVSAVVVVFSSGFLQLAIGFSLMGISRALSSGSLEAHFVDELYRIDPEVDLQKIMAKVGTITTISLALSSLFGGYIPGLMEGIPLDFAGLNPYSFNYFFYMIIILIQYLLTTFLVSEEKPELREASILNGVKKVPEMLASSILYGLKQPVIFAILMAALIWGFSISGLEQFWQPRLQEILEGRQGTEIYGYLSFGYFLAAAIGSLLSISFCNLFGRRYNLVLFLTKILMGGFFLILAFRTSLLGFSVFYLLTFAANGMSSSPESAVFNRVVPSRRRSTITSLVSFFLQLGGLLGSLLMGLLARRFSISLAWVVAAVALVLSSFLYIGISTGGEAMEVRDEG